MFNLQSFLSHAKDFMKSAKYYPVELCMSLFLFFSFVIRVEFVEMPRSDCFLDFFLPIWTFCVLPFVITIIIRCDWWNRTKSNIAKYAYYASGLLLLLPGVIFYDFDKVSIEIICGTYLLAFGLFISSGLYWDNRKYAYSGSQMFHQLCSSIIVAGVFALAYFAVVGSIIYLFLDYSFESVKNSFVIRCLVLYGSWFIASVFFPMFLTHKITEVREQKEEDVSRVLNFCANYILIPFLLIYTIILYVYACKILIQWNLPQGMVSWMVIVYIFLAFIGHALQNIISNKRFERFFRFLPYISIVPLVLYWVGLGRRLSDYGLTESRIYLLVFGILATIFMVFLLFKKTNHYLLMSGIASVAIIFLAYVPWTNATCLAALSQLSTVNDFVEKYDLLNEKQRQFKEYKDWNADAIADTTGLKNFVSAYLYLGDYSVKKKVENVIQYDSVYSIYGHLSAEIKHKRDSQGSSYDDTNSYFSHKRPDCPINVKKYPFFCKKCRVDLRYEVDALMYIYDGAELITTIDLKSHINDNFSVIRQNSIPKEKTEQVFTIKNDSVLVILDDISVDVIRENNQITSLQSNEVLIFSVRPLEDVSTSIYSVIEERGEKQYCPK